MQIECVFFTCEPLPCANKSVCDYKYTPSYKQSVIRTYISCRRHFCQNIKFKLIYKEMFSCEKIYLVESKNANI